MNQQIQLSNRHYVLAILRRAGIIWLVLCLLIMLPVNVTKEHTAAQADFSLRLLLAACFVIYPLLAIWASWFSIMIQKRNLSERQRKK